MLEKSSCKFIIITGGVISSLGKGVTASSIAALLQAYGYKIRLKKLDPYLNVDPGTMSPYQHGEVFVTSDGSEADLDLGYYERFTGNNATKFDTTTSGKLYEKLIQAERKGEYCGGTVQTIPHFTQLVKDFITLGREDCDFMICEIGGTVGDVEASPYLEAARQLQYEVGNDNLMSIHLTLLPYVTASGELKTKPTQHSVKELRSVGVHPDMIVCRADRQISRELLRKIALSCSVKEENTIEAQDLQTIYQVPLSYHSSGVDKQILKHFALASEAKVDLSKWYWINERMQSYQHEVVVGVIGKYNKLQDAYKSLLEALLHAGIHSNCKVNIELIDSDEVKQDKVAEIVDVLDGVLIPGGFGSRGVDGKMNAIQYSREIKKPLFGICLGMQLMAIEFARNVMGITNADSAEFNSDCANIIDLMINWVKDGNLETRSVSSDLGGTMRLGSYKSALIKGSKLANIYNAEAINERHRHRFEFNLNYREQFEESGMKVGSISFDGKLVESMELIEHPWFIGVQFHPEYNSKPFDPHPLFLSFVNTMIEAKKSRLT